MFARSTSYSDHAPATERTFRPFDLLRRPFQRLLSALTLWEELHRLTPRELADMGISPADFPSIVRGTYQR